MTATAVLKMNTPGGRPFDLVVSAETTEEEALAVVMNAGKLGIWLEGKGCSFVNAQPALAEQRALTAAPTGPTFAGYPCSEDIDRNTGFPSWIISKDGKQADWHSQQGDNWYSYRTGPGPKDFQRVFTIRKGGKVPQILGLPSAG